MASVIYDIFRTKFANKTFDFVNDTIKVALVTSAYTPNVGTHTSMSNITNEITDTGYVRKTLANKSVTNDTTNHREDFKADNVTWTALGPTSGGQTGALAIVYKDVDGTDANAILMMALDFTDQTFNGGDFTLKWDGQASNGRLLSMT